MGHGRCLRERWFDDRRGGSAQLRSNRYSRAGATNGDASGPCTVRWGYDRRVRAGRSAGPAVIQVDFYPSTSVLDSHFVLALHEEDGDMVIIDPWTGSERKLLQTYGPGRSLASAIFALAEYKIPI